jgi:hypothetical protein
MVLFKMAGGRCEGELRGGGLGRSRLSRERAQRARATELQKQGA